MNYVIYFYNQMLQQYRYSTIYLIRIRAVQLYNLPDSRCRMLFAGFWNWIAGFVLCTSTMLYCAKMARKNENATVRNTTLAMSCFSLLSPSELLNLPDNRLRDTGCCRTVQIFPDNPARQISVSDNHSNNTKLCKAKHNSKWCRIDL